MTSIYVLVVSKFLTRKEGGDMKITDDVFDKRSYNEGEDGVRNRREVGACLLAAEKLGIEVKGFGPWYGLHAMRIYPEGLTVQERRLIVRRAKSISEDEVREFWAKLENEMFLERD